tara:strand:+ start:303 stop:713 length:411 start_codon:yes stop_codon:yes gene_type:complete
MAIAKMVNVNVTIVLLDRTAVPMHVQWDAFTVNVPKKVIVCVTMVFVEQIVQLVDALPIATAMACAVVLSVSVVLDLLETIVLLFLVIVRVPKRMTKRITKIKNKVVVVMVVVVQEDANAMHPLEVTTVRTKHVHI